MKIIEILFNKAADFSYKDHQDRIILHLTYAEDNLVTITFLSDDRLDLTITDKQEYNCLHYEVLSNSASTTAWLLN